MSGKITAVIAAAGSGTRMGGSINKVFMPLGEGTVIGHTAAALAGCAEIDDIVIVTRACDVLECMEYIGGLSKHIRIVRGGETRQESVYRGIKAAADSDMVVIHDGARALVLPETVTRTIMDACTFGAAAAGVLCKDSLKRVSRDGFIEETLDRQSTYLIQTPQIFKTEDILRAHELAARDGFSATDDCALYEKYIGKIKVTEGSYENIKLTTPEDMIIAENILKRRSGEI